MEWFRIILLKHVLFATYVLTGRIECPAFSLARFIWPIGQISFQYKLSCVFCVFRHVLAALRWPRREMKSSQSSSQALFAVLRNSLPRLSERRQRGGDNLEATTWKRQLRSDNSEATTWKRQLGRDNLEATTWKRQLGSDNLKEYI